MKPFLRWCFVATALTLADAVILPGVKVKSSRYHCNRLTAGSDSGTYGTNPCQSGFNHDERAQLLYERGVLYDSLGLGH